MRTGMLVVALAAVMACACSDEGASSATVAPDTLTGAPMPPPPAWASGAIGKPIAELYPGSATLPETCVGFVDALTEYYSGDAGARYEGWAWSTSQSKPYPRLLASDADGIVRGAGETSIERGDVPPAMPGVVTDPRVGFAVIATITNSAVKIYGINDETHSTCLIGQYPNK